MPATISKTNKRTEARKRAEDQKAKKKQARDVKLSAKNAPAKKSKSGKRK